VIKVTGRGTKLNRGSFDADALDHPASRKGGASRGPGARPLSGLLVLLAGGSVVGLLLGVGASRVLSHIVFEATAQDPTVLAAVAVTILLSGSLAVAGPVRRALRVDPANVLRDQ